MGVMKSAVKLGISSIDCWPARKARSCRHWPHWTFLGRRQPAGLVNVDQRKVNYNIKQNHGAQRNCTFWNGQHQLGKLQSGGRRPPTSTTAVFLVYCSCAFHHALSWSMTSIFKWKTLLEEKTGKVELSFPT